MKALQFGAFSLKALLLCVLIPSNTANCQVSPRSVEMTGKEFEVWIAQSANSNQDSAQPPKFCQAIVERLKASKDVTDQTILRCVEAYVAAGENSARNQTDAVAEHRFDAAEQFIDELLPLLSDRENLMARLMVTKGTIAVSLSQFSKASQSFQQSLNLIEPLRLDLDLQRQSTLVKLGQALLSLNQKKDAEGYFLKALSYPWYTIEGRPSEQRELRDQYILAGMGLIESRRGNLDALQQTVFVPATQEKLGPLLDKAIREAGGKPK